MLKSNEIKIRYVKETDRDFWFSLDRHLSYFEFQKKVRDRQGYVILAGDIPVGILRYNLFWDNTPFCTLLFIDKNYQRRGYGKMIMNFWENEMRLKSYDFLLVSTQADEGAQHFYRKLGYRDCGGLIFENQATELFMRKDL